MNPQNGQTPLDYLNQIAPQTPKKQGIGLNLRTIIIAGVIIVIIVIVLAVVAGSIAGGRKTPWQELSARLATTKTITEDASKKLKNSQIRSANTDLTLYLTNIQRTIEEPLTRQDIDAEKLPASITTQESGTAMIERLEDARLNAKFDSTYAREMSYQLSTILALYQELYSIAGTDATKEFLESSYNNLLPIQQTIADFSASNE